MNTGVIIAEFIGTFILIISILITGNPIYIAAAFLAAITIVGKFSGGHINPVVSLTMFLNGTIKSNQILEYIGPQIIAAVSAFYMYQYLIKKDIKSI